MSSHNHGLKHYAILIHHWSNDRLKIGMLFISHFHLLSGGYNVEYMLYMSHKVSPIIYNIVSALILIERIKICIQNVLNKVKYLQIALMNKKLTVNVSKDTTHTCNTMQNPGDIHYVPTSRVYTSSDNMAYHPYWTLSDHILKLVPCINNNFDTHSTNNIEPVILLYNKFGRYN